MEKPIMKDGIPTCPACNSQEFVVTCKELVSYKLDASKKGEGWGDKESLENLHPNPYEGIICEGCDIDLEVTSEVQEFFFAIGG